MATQQVERANDNLDATPVAGDRELALSFQRGDRWAYDLIYRRYSARVQHVCQRMLSDPQEAQDAAQETFLRVYQALPRFNGRYQLGAWINRIATNVCLDLIRARNRTPYDAAPNDVLDDWVGSNPDDGPEEALLRRAEGTRVQETLASLSPAHRTAITLRDLEGRAYSDVASRLGMPEARARVVLHRARKGFKRSWASAYVFMGMPLRLLQRARRAPAQSEHLMQAVNSAAQAGPAAANATLASCSQALHGCGGVVSERIAAVATAALVGVGAAASGAGPGAIMPSPEFVARPASPITAGSQTVRDVRDATAAGIAAVSIRSSPAAPVEDGSSEAEGETGINLPPIDPPLPGESPTGETGTTPTDEGADPAGGVVTPTDPAPGEESPSSETPADPTGTEAEPPPDPTSTDPSPEEPADSGVLDPPEEQPPPVLEPSGEPEPTPEPTPSPEPTAGETTPPPPGETTPPPPGETTLASDGLDAPVMARAGLVAILS